jgi:hypothetical protein
MKARIIGLSFLLIISAGAAAESNQQRLAGELLDLTAMDASIEQTARQMGELMVAQLAQLPVARAHQVESQRYLERIRLLILATMTWENLRADYIEAYTETFTEAELGALVEFFRTSEGHRYIEQLQNLQQRALSINERHAQRIAPAIRAITAEMQAALSP